MNDWNRTYIDREPAMSAACIRNIPYGAFLKAFGHSQVIVRSIFDEWLIEQCAKSTHEMTR